MNLSDEEILKEFERYKVSTWDKCADWETWKAAIAYCQRHVVNESLITRFPKITNDGYNYDDPLNT